MKEFHNFVYKHIVTLKNHKRYIAMLTALSIFVSFMVPLILIEPADSMTKQRLMMLAGDGTLSYPTSFDETISGNQSNMVPNAAGANGNQVGDVTYSPAQMDILTLLFGAANNGSGNLTHQALYEGCTTIEEALEVDKETYFLGYASDFCAFIEGDFTATEADAEGRVAVGGDLTFTNGWNYQIGSGDYATMKPLQSINGYNEYDNIYGFASALVGGKMSRINTLSTGYGHTRTSKDSLSQEEIQADIDAGYHAVNKDDKYSYSVYYKPEDGLYKYFIVGNTDGSSHYFKEADKDIPYNKNLSPYPDVECTHDYKADCEICVTNPETHSYLGNINELAQMYSMPDGYTVGGLIRDTFEYVRSRSEVLTRINSINVTPNGDNIIFDATGKVKPDAKTVYFTVDNWTGNYGYIEFKGIPENASVIVNCNNSGVVYAVGGQNNAKKDVTTVFNGKPISNKDGPGNNSPESSRILYNFPNATELHINGNFNGTILAPNADVKSKDNECTGHLSGALIAKSFYGGLEFGYRPYRASSDILGMTSGYEVPVDKLIANTATLLPGAMFEIAEVINDKENVLSLFESDDSTKYAALPSYIDFLGNTNYITESESVVNNQTKLETLSVTSNTELKSSVEITAYRTYNNNTFSDPIAEDDLLNLNIGDTIYLVANQNVKWFGGNFNFDQNPALYKQVQINSELNNVTITAQLSDNIKDTITLSTEEIKLVVSPKYIVKGDTVNYSLTGVSSNNSLHYKMYYFNEYNNEIELSQGNNNSTTYNFDRTGTVHVKTQFNNFNYTDSFEVMYLESPTECTVGETISFSVPNAPSDATITYTFNGSNVENNTSFVVPDSSGDSIPIVANITWKENDEQISKVIEKTIKVNASSESNSGNDTAESNNENIENTEKTEGEYASSSVTNSLSILEDENSENNSVFEITSGAADKYITNLTLNFQLLENINNYSFKCTYHSENGTTSETVSKTDFNSYTKSFNENDKITNVEVEILTGAVTITSYDLTCVVPCSYLVKKYFTDITANEGVETTVFECSESISDFESLTFKLDNNPIPDNRNIGLKLYKKEGDNYTEIKSIWDGCSFNTNGELVINNEFLKNNSINISDLRRITIQAKDGATNLHVNEYSLSTFVSDPECTLPEKEPEIITETHKYTIKEAMAPQGYFKTDDYYEVTITETLSTANVVNNTIPMLVNTEIHVDYFKAIKDENGNTTRYEEKAHYYQAPLDIRYGTKEKVDGSGDSEPDLNTRIIEIGDETFTIKKNNDGGKITSVTSGDTELQLSEEKLLKDCKATEFTHNEKKYYYNPETMMIIPLPLGNDTEKNLEFSNELGLLFKKVDERGMSVEGATISLTTKGEPITFTDSSKLFELSNFVLGTEYEFSETNKPNGYENAKPIKFKIFNDENDENKLKVTWWTVGENDTKINEKTQLVEDTVIEMVDERILGVKLQLKKIDADTKANLSGAIFELYASDDTLIKSGIAAGDGTGVDIDLTQGIEEAGNKFIENGYLKPSSYYLLETSRPTDSSKYPYKDPGKICFTVGDAANNYGITYVPNTSGGNSGGSGSTGKQYIESIESLSLSESNAWDGMKWYWLKINNQYEMAEPFGASSGVPEKGFANIKKIVVQFGRSTTIEQLYYDSGKSNGASDENKAGLIDNNTKKFEVEFTPRDIYQFKFVGKDVTVESVQFIAEDDTIYEYLNNSSTGSGGSSTIEKQYIESIESLSLSETNAWDGMKWYWLKINNQYEMAEPFGASSGVPEKGFANIKKIVVQFGGSTTIEQLYYDSGKSNGASDENKAGLIDNNTKKFEVEFTPRDIYQFKFVGKDVTVESVQFIAEDDTIYAYPSVSTFALTASLEDEISTAANGDEPAVIDEADADTKAPILAPVTSEGDNKTTLVIGNEVDDGKVDITVKKVWPNDGFDSARPSVTIKLYRTTTEISETERNDPSSIINGQQVFDSDDNLVEVTLSGDTWSHTFTDLDSRYADENGGFGQYYYYIIEDTVVGYTAASYTIVGNELTVTNELDPVEVKVEKIWNTENVDTIPESVKLQLQVRIESDVNGPLQPENYTWENVEGKTITLVKSVFNGSKTWSGDDFKITGLLKGKTYRLTETDVPGWRITDGSQKVLKVDENGNLTDLNGQKTNEKLSITNEPKPPETGNLTISKYWDTDEGKPGEVYVKLYRKAIEKYWPEQSAADVQQDYARLLQYSLYFYDANMCGDTAEEHSALSWRGDCHTDDEVKGGYHDAGDHVMFGLPQGYSASMLGWSYYEFKDAYDDLGQTEHLKLITEHFCDFFVQSIRNNNGTTEILVQKGAGNPDHKYWGAPELQVGKYSRMDEVELTDDGRGVTGWPDGKKTLENEMFWRSDTGGDIAAEYAAALALAYLNFYDENASQTEKDKYNGYLAKAIEFYNFAQGKGVLEEWGVNKDETATKKEYPGFYGSGGANDDRAWAAGWLYLATNTQAYKNACKNDTPGWAFSWNDVSLAAACVYAHVNGDTSDAWSKVREFLTGGNGINSNLKSDGYFCRDAWGSARYNAALQMVALVAAKYNTSEAQTYKNFAQTQMAKILGANDWNNGYPVCLVTGFADNSAKYAHHRAASGWDYHSEYLINSNYDKDGHMLIGAMVGGPSFGKHGEDQMIQNGHTNLTTDVHGTYVDDLHDYCCNEVALDYQAGLVGAAAGLYHFFESGHTYEIPGVEKQYLQPEPEAVTVEAGTYSSRAIRQDNAVSKLADGDTVETYTLKGLVWNLENAPDCNLVKVTLYQYNSTTGQFTEKTLTDIKKSSESWKTWWYQLDIGSLSETTFAGLSIETSGTQGAELTIIVDSWNEGNDAAYRKKVTVPATGTATWGIVPPSISIDCDDTDIIVGDSIILVPSGATSYKWVSSDDSIISVNENGIATGNKEGNAIITLYDANNEEVFDSIEITVKEFKITSNDNEITLSEGGVEVEITANAEAEWSFDSKYNEILEITSNTKTNTLKIKAKSYTTDEITLTAKYKEGVTDTVKIKITSGILRFINGEDGKTFEVHVGKSTNVDFNLTNGVIISDLNESIAEISQNQDGTWIITGKEIGNSSFKATRGNTITGTINVLPALSITADSGMLYNGETLQLSYNNNIGNVTWSIPAEQQSIATVDSNGIVTAHGKGEVTVTATDVDGTTATYNITVKLKAVDPGFDYSNGGFEYVDKYTISGNNGWELTIDNLDLTDENGNYYMYYIVECDGSGNPISSNGTIQSIQGIGATFVPTEYENGVMLAQVKTNAASVKNSLSGRVQGQLPSTGGSGVKTYYYIGGAIMLLGIAGFTGIKRRERRRRKE